MNNFEPVFAHTELFTISNGTLKNQTGALASFKLPSGTDRINQIGVFIVGQGTPMAFSLGVRSGKGTIFDKLPNKVYLSDGSDPDHKGKTANYPYEEGELLFVEWTANQDFSESQTFAVCFFIHKKI